MKNIQKILLGGLLGLSAVLAAQSQAHATQIDYDLTGYSSLTFNSKNSNASSFMLLFGFGAGGTAQHYDFKLDTATGEGWFTANVSGKVTSTTDWNQALSDDLVTGTITMHYTGLTIGKDPVTGKDVVAIGRTGANGTGTVSLHSNFFGGGLNLSFGLEDKFAFPQGGVANNDVYGNLGLQPFDLLFGALPNLDEVFKAWVMSGADVHIFGQTYGVTGDIHTQVPEPASLALLGTALLGTFRKRRKARAAA